MWFPCTASIVQYILFLTLASLLHSTPYGTASSSSCKAQTADQLQLNTTIQRELRRKSSQKIRYANYFYPLLFHTPNQSVPTFSAKFPVHNSLFGSIRNISASEFELRPYAHPRIFGPGQYRTIVESVANSHNFNKLGSWSQFLLNNTLEEGPLSPFISKLAEMEHNHALDLYDGRPAVHGSKWYGEYRLKLKPLADVIHTMNAARSSSFSFCAFWASVNNIHEELKIRYDLEEICIKAAVAWSKILLAHHAYHCNTECIEEDEEEPTVFIWDSRRPWKPSHERISAALSLSFSYDILYTSMSKEQQKTIRSALALFVLNRSVWIPEDFSSYTPYESTFQLLSHVAMQQASLFLINLAIEKERNFDGYVTRVLRQYGSFGFNIAFHARFTSLIHSYLKYSFNEDGSSGEEGKSYFLGLREGALAMVAAQRRGHNIMDTPRFRNLIHHAAQMYEPRKCGRLIGHACGGGHGPPTFLALFKYMYPNGTLPAVLWKLRMGDFAEESSCRKFWKTSLPQLLFLGGDHNTEMNRFSDLPKSSLVHFPLSYYSPKRGLLVMRNSHSGKGVYAHFDIRTDAVLLTEKSSDRGTFTYAALGRPWVDDLSGSHYSASDDHSILQMDNIGQGSFVPPGRAESTYEDGMVVLANADLTYAYNNEWVWKRQRLRMRAETERKRDGSAVGKTKLDQEMSSMWQLGWPGNDSYPNKVDVHEPLPGRRIMQGCIKYAHVQAMRREPLSYVKRSVGLIRSNQGVGVFFVGDFVAGNESESKKHVFEHYFMLHRSVHVDSVSYCREKQCRIFLRNGKEQLLLITTSKGELEYRTERVGKSTKVILRSTGSREAFWTFFLADNREFHVDHRNEGVKIRYGNEKYRLAVGEDMMVRRVMRSKRTMKQIEFSKIAHVTKYLRRRKMFNSEADYEAILSIRAISNSTHIDGLSTSIGTLAHTELKVYDCGEAFDYRRMNKSSCTEMRMKHVKCKSNRLRARVKGRLEGGKKYVVAVSVWDVDGEQRTRRGWPNVSLQHQAVKQNRTMITTEN